jgi:hypothetical protein
MQRLANYLVAHWQGRHGLLRSTLLNGLLTYLVLVLLLNLFEPDAGGVSLFIGMGVFLFWALWALVGIVRSALHALGQNNPVLVRAGVLVTLLAVAAVLALAVNDLSRLGLIR